MKQISQSQFIPISGTLCELVRGLNENQIAATFESILSRLSSSFNSIVIPPKTAIKKSLEILIAERKLDFINGSYFVKSKTTSLKPGEMPSTTTQTKIKVKDTTRHALPSIMPRPKIKYECLNSGEEKARPRHFDYSGKFKTEPLTKIKSSKKGLISEKKNARIKRNKMVKSGSLKVRRSDQCIPRRQFSYEELRSHAKQSELFGNKKQVKKRNSFLGRLSRFFKMEEDKLNSNNEIANNTDNEWENIATDEHVKLWSDKVETFDKREDCKKATQRRTKYQRMTESKQNINTKCGGKLVRYAQSRKSAYKKQKYPSRSSKSSISTTNVIRRNRNLTMEELKNSLTGEKSGEQCSLSSYSNSSFSNKDSDWSLSSDSSDEVAKKSFHFSEADTSGDDCQLACQKDGDFCSTQAICGDLELSSLSLNTGNNLNFSSLSDTTGVKHVEKHSDLPGVNENEAQDDQNNLRSRNLLQLIGVL